MDAEFQIGKWQAYPSRGVIEAEGETIQLEPRVMDLLVCFARHPDEVLSKEQLIQKVWPDTFVADDVLTSAIWKLRQALGDDPKSPGYIETIPRRGYRLLAEVQFYDEAIDSREPLLEKSEGQTTGHSPRAYWTPAVLLVLLGAPAIAIF